MDNEEYAEDQPPQGQRGHSQPILGQEGHNWINVQVNSYHQIAQRAHARFGRRYNIEWKFTIAFWTLFVVAAGFVLSVDTSSLPTGGAAIVLMIATILVVGFLLWLFWLWLRWMTLADEYDRQLSINCQDRIREELELNYTDDKLNEITERLEKRRKIVQGVHIASMYNFFVAVAFAVFFLFLVGTKGCSSSPAVPASDMRIEQGSLEIEGTATLKLGNQ